MSRTETISITSTARTRLSRGFAILKKLMIWNAAWCEYYRLQRLDPAALRDMGISAVSRRSVTVSEIAARMRAGA